MQSNFTNEQKEEITNKIKAYFERELDSEIGGFEAEFLLEFFAKEIGGYFYNQGLEDAQKTITEQMESLQNKLYSMEEIV